MNAIVRSQFGYIVVTLRRLVVLGLTYPCTNTPLWGDVYDIGMEELTASERVAPLKTDVDTAINILQAMSYDDKDALDMTEWGVDEVLSRSDVTDARGSREEFRGRLATLIMEDELEFLEVARRQSDGKYIKGSQVEMARVLESALGSREEWDERERVEWIDARTEFAGHA